MLKNLFNFRTAASTIFISSNAYLFSQTLRIWDPFNSTHPVWWWHALQVFSISPESEMAFCIGAEPWSWVKLWLLFQHKALVKWFPISEQSPILQGSLLLRAAWQSVSDTRFKSNSKITKIFEIIDRYPCLGRIDRSPGTAAIAVGAFWTMTLIWRHPQRLTIANLCLAASDPALQAKFMPKLR